MTFQVDKTRTTLTAEEKKFNSEYSNKGIKIVPPAEAFKTGDYNYELREQKLKNLSVEHTLLVSTANKLSMCILVEDFIFTPPESNEKLSSEILNALKMLIDKALR